jgi:uncharacterized protein YbaP (TraB family)
MMKSRHRYSLCPGLLLLLFVSPLILATELIAPECQELEEYEEITPQIATYGEGLLWKISKVGTPHSYVFGTIHVSDESIVKLPEEIDVALMQASIFVMEVVPEPEEVRSVASLMYFNDGNKLSDLISKPLYEEVVRLLDSYHLPEVAVELLKPWAAFLTMSYPPEFGQVLDMQLLEKARSHGAKVSGLESMQEQIDIFDSLSMKNQIKILSDTACHYATVENDFEKMKSLYIARDLSGLYAYSQRYSMSDDEVYNDLIKRILFDRNYTMAKRMQPMLENGNAFIAIGAMHLPGDEGVLSLLAKNNYEISLVY